MCGSNFIYTHLTADLKISVLMHVRISLRAYSIKMQQKLFVNMMYLDVLFMF